MRATMALIGLEIEKYIANTSADLVMVKRDTEAPLKILFIGDPHLKITRFELAKSFLNWTEVVVGKTRPDVVVNLGDTFDTHSVIRSEVMTEFVDHVKAILALHIPYIYVVGNHDLFKPNDYKYHALLHLKGVLKNFHVVDSIQELYDITFVPYQHNLALFPNKTSKICVAHQSFLGADYGSIVDKNGIDQNKIQGCELIISGHIHKRQQLDGPVPVIYPGSPFSQSANDIDQVKGLMLFDTATYKHEFIECPLPKWRRISVEINTDTDVDIFLKHYLKPIMGSRDHFVIELTGTKNHLLKLMNLKEYKEHLNGLSVSVKTIFTDKEKKMTSISSSFSVETIISDYMDKVYSGPLNKEELKIKALEILKSSKASM